MSAIGSVAGIAELLRDRGKIDHFGVKLIRNPLGLVIVGGLSLSTAMTLYVVPIVYVLMDRLCVRLTGRSSAAGLKRAEEIKEQTDHGPEGRMGEPAMAK